MRILDTPIAGLKLIEFEPICDSRGHFARAFCARDFERHGLQATIAQMNLSYSHHKGTLRGLHFQVLPCAETKVIRCTRGAILDIVVDIRPESATFLQHFTVELTPDNGRALYIPQRFANGYLTLTDGAEATYHVDEFYNGHLERGLRFDDPTLQLRLPIEPSVVSDKDHSWPLLDDERLAVIRRELQA